MRTAVPLVIGTEWVTVSLPDDVQNIMRRWAMDHSADLQERLAGTGVNVYEIQLPEYRRMVFEDDDEVVQAAIDSGQARRVPNHADRSE